MTKVEQRYYSRGYYRGYQSGRAGKWPEFAPPSPPVEQVRQLLDAARELNEAAVTVLSVIDADEEIFQTLQVHQTAMDAAFAAVMQWLKTQPV